MLCIKPVSQDGISFALKYFLNKPVGVVGIIVRCFDSECRISCMENFQIFTAGKMFVYLFVEKMNVFHFHHVHIWFFVFHL